MAVVITLLLGFAGLSDADYLLASAEHQTEICKMLTGIAVSTPVNITSL